MELGDRMKSYEESVGHKLIKRMPAILRVDGRAFHTYTRKYTKPFDQTLSNAMASAATLLCEEISTAKLAYFQSDEISILLTDYDNFDTEQWFGGKVQKISSVGASIATVGFNLQVLQEELASGNEVNLATFDARCFNIPQGDITNYFLWRQRDCKRNSINGTAQEIFSHKELQGKNTDEVRTMLEKSGSPWENQPEGFKNGFVVVRTDLGWEVKPADRDIRGLVGEVLYDSEPKGETKIPS